MNSNKHRPVAGARCTLESTDTQIIPHTRSMTPEERITALVERLHAKRVGREWRTHCPCHDDKHASLDFRLEKGKILFSDRAGCASGDVLAALRAQWPDLLGVDDRLEWQIRDAQGRHVATHVRYAGPCGKRYAWIGPNGSPGLNGTKAVDLPLYRAERLDTDLAAAVVMTEGEKAADALASVGVSAVGTVTGASSCPTTPVLSVLQGRRVYLWPDNDEPGRRHMEKIHTMLQGIAASVSMVSWPDAPSRGDAHDFVKRYRQGAAKKIAKLLDTSITPPTLSFAEPTISAGIAQARIAVADTFKLTESGDAEFFAALYADSVRYDHTRHRWLKLQSHGIWRPQSKGQVTRLALDSMRKRQRLAVGVEANLKWAAGGESAIRRRHLLELASVEPAVSDDGLLWDVDPLLLGTPGGVVDLQTGKLREGRPEDRVTKQTAATWDPTARSELLDRVLEHALPDPAVRRFLRMLAGLTLAGMTGENVLPLIFGVTRSSKGTVLDALRSALGEYATTADLSTFATNKYRNGSAASPDLAALIGARMCSVYEAGRRVRLDTSLVKTLSGSDPITARPLYENPIEFRPTFLVWIATDTRPTVPEDDAAFFERVCEIPFNVYLAPEERDRTVRERLIGTDEGVAVLAWAWAGLQDYRQYGLRRPPAVQQAIAAYQAEMNPTQEFVHECLSIEKGHWTPALVLRTEYERWCREKGSHPTSGTHLAAALATLGCKAEKRVHVRGWLGIRVREP